MRTTKPTPLELMTPAEEQAATGRAYLRGAVTLLEHAVVLLAHVPADEREPVPALADRLGEALGYLRDGTAPAPVEVPVEAPLERMGEPAVLPPAPAGALW